MKCSSLADITYYKNSDGGELFTIINYFNYRFNHLFVKELSNYTKTLLLDKLLELLEKYEYNISLWDVENYLDERDNIAYFNSILSIENADIRNKDKEEQKELMYAYEFINYGFGLEEYIASTPLEKIDNDFNNYFNLKYPNFVINKDTLYNDYLKNVMDNNEMFNDKLEKVIVDFRPKIKKKSNDYCVS